MILTEKGRLARNSFLTGVFTTLVVVAAVMDPFDLFEGEKEELIENRDRLTKDARNAFDEMQDVLECYTGYRGTGEIKDPLTITKPAGADGKPRATDEGAWQIWNSKLNKKTRIHQFRFGRSDIEIDNLDKELREELRKLKEKPNMAFYLVSSSDGTYDEDRLKNDDWPPYVFLQTSLLRSNMVLKVLNDEGINPNRVCRIPLGRTVSLGQEDAEARSAILYAFDTGLQLNAE